MTLSERFWSKISIVHDPNSCWEWCAGLTDGYGRFYVNADNQSARATHVLWFILYGEWPTKWILHKCDNPKCVRPSHLFEGTAKENAADCISKGRFSYSDGHPKLTPANVREIRELYTQGNLSQYDLAPLYGVSRSAIKHVLSGKTWRTVEGL
jgi:hypothetical protein